MIVVFTRRISRHKMWWRVWQWEGQIGFGAATGLDMAEGLKIKNLVDVSESHSAMSGPVTAPIPIWPSPNHTLHHILCLDIHLVNTTLISAHICNFGAGKFCDDMTCVLPSISQPNLYQIQLLGGVSESSGPAESKTVIEIQFWARFHGEKRENVRDKWNCGYCILRAAFN